MKKKNRVTIESKDVILYSWKEFAAKLVTSIAVRGFLLWLPILYSDAIDWASKGNFEKAYYFIILSLIATLIFYIVSWINQIVFRKLYNKLYKRYTRLATHATFQNSIYSLSRFSLGEYANILNNDVDIICAFYSNGVIRVIQILELLIIYSYFLSMDFVIFFITVIVSIFMLLVLILSGKKVQKYNAERKDTLDTKTAIVHEIFLGIKEIKGFHVLQSVNSRMREKCRAYVDSFSKYDNYVVGTQFAVQTIIQIARFSLVFYGLYLMSLGKMELGVIMLIYTYYQKIIDNFGIVSTVAAEYRNLKVSRDRFNKILEFSQKNDKIITLKDSTFEGNICFEDVLYGNKNDPILNLVSFEIHANQINVITGKAGSGKTGILDLLLKMNHQHSGVVKLDDIDIDNIDGEIYYNLISSVRKQPIFFDLSIKENLMLIDENFEHIQEICKLLNIHDYICTLSNSYDTAIHGTEDNIVNNVKLLLAIARVLLRNSKIMLFDECISVLERDSQEIVLELLEKIKGEHTIVIVSREKEILKHADNIIAMDHNYVVETGSHKELMKNRKCYYHLYAEV